METLEQKFEDILWVANSLFERGKTAGSSANISFRHEDKVYISGSGTCFGRLKKEDFAVVNLQGKDLGDKKPSKEWPLHLNLYNKTEEIQSVIHIHSFYATLLSCYKHERTEDVIPDITPYLNMKLGKVVLIPYEKPGSQELFQAMQEKIELSNGFLLKNHGPIVGSKSIMDTFYAIEELEESARIACVLRNENVDKYDII